jgi:hypothetical protein
VSVTGNAGEVDLAEFDAASLTRKGCGVPRVRLELTDDQRVKLDAAMAAAHISSGQIERVVKTWGHQLSNQVVLRHRTGRCSCD